MSSLRTPEMRLLFAGYPSPKQPLVKSATPGGLIYFKLIWVGGWGGGGLIETGSLFKLEKTVVSVLHKELEYKVEKLKYDKVGDHAAEDHWESNPTFQPGPGVRGGRVLPPTIPDQSTGSFTVVITD